MSTILERPEAFRSYHDFLWRYNIGLEAAAVRQSLEETRFFHLAEEGREPDKLAGFALAQWECQAHLDPDVLTALSAHSSDAEIAALAKKLSKPKASPKKRSKPREFLLPFRKGDCLAMKLPDGKYCGFVVMRAPEKLEKLLEGSTVMTDIYQLELPTFESFLKSNILQEESTFDIWDKNDIIGCINHFNIFEFIQMKSFIELVLIGRINVLKPVICMEGGFWIYGPPSQDEIAGCLKYGQDPWYHHNEMKNKLTSQLRSTIKTKDFVNLTPGFEEIELILSKIHDHKSGNTLILSIKLSEILINRNLIKKFTCIDKHWHLRKINEDDHLKNHPFISDEIANLIKKSFCFSKMRATQILEWALSSPEEIDETLTEPSPFDPRLDGLSWSFNGKSYADIKKFKTAFKKYNRDFSENEFTEDFILLPGVRQVRVCYTGQEYYQKLYELVAAGQMETEPELDDLFVDIDASGPGDLSILDLMYQFHQATLKTLNSDSMDNVFFEGFSLADEEDEGRKVLFMRQGS